MAIPLIKNQIRCPFRLREGTANALHFFRGWCRDRKLNLLFSCSSHTKNLHPILLSYALQKQELGKAAQMTLVQPTQRRCLEMVRT